MFDRQKIRDCMVLLLACAVLFEVLGWPLATERAWTLLGILGILFMSLKASVLPKVTARIFDFDPKTEDLYKHMAGDPQFRSSVEYVYGLSSHDFMKFCRLCVEIRDKSNQLGLKDVADAFRLNRDSGLNKGL